MDTLETTPKHLPVTNKEFTRQLQNFIHTGAMEQLYFQRTGSDFVYDQHFPEVAERVDQVSRGLLIKGKFNDYKGDEEVILPA